MGHLHRLLLAIHERVGCAIPIDSPASFYPDCYYCVPLSTESLSVYGYKDLLPSYEMVFKDNTHTILLNPFLKNKTK